MSKAQKNPDRGISNDRIIWVVVILVVFIGVVITGLDYREWRRAETDKFGQGWGDMDTPAKELEVTYNPAGLGLRLRLPADWEVVQKARVEELGGEFVEVAEVEKIMKVSMAYMSGNLVDMVDDRVDDLKKQGMDMEERAYIGEGNLDVTILEWRQELPGGKAVVFQEAWGKLRDKVIRLETQVGEEKWSELKKTLWVIYENLEMVY